MEEEPWGRSLVVLRGQGSGSCRDCSPPLYTTARGSREESGLAVMKTEEGPGFNSGAALVGSKS